MTQTRLDQYNNSWYKPGRNGLVRLIWYFINAIIFQSYLLPINTFKIALLRAFGATVGQGVIIKPSVNIKYPWNLEIGNHTWIGEKVWIDNLVKVKIGNHVCLSQGAMLLTGNHNYKKETFDLIVHEITLEDGVWIGVKSLVCPGVVCGSHAVLSAQSVATTNLEPYFIYSGTPAHKVRERVID
jgi:putative colanic acid biosynthesis acetyltransferase WcaF